MGLWVAERSEEAGWGHHMSPGADRRHAASKTIKIVNIYIHCPIHSCQCPYSYSYVYEQMNIMQWSSPTLMRCNSQRNFIYGSIIHNDWETLSAVSYLMKLHNQNQCIAITCQLFSIISYVTVKLVSVWFWLWTEKRRNIEFTPSNLIFRMTVTNF